MKVRRRRREDASVSLEHLSLHVDGEVTEHAVLALLVQLLEQRTLDIRKEDLNCGARGGSSPSTSPVHWPGWPA